MVWMDVGVCLNRGLLADHSPLIGRAPQHSVLTTFDEGPLELLPYPPPSHTPPPWQSGGPRNVVGRNSCSETHIIGLLDGNKTLQGFLAPSFRSWFCCMLLLFRPIHSSHHSHAQNFPFTKRSPVLKVDSAGTTFIIHVAPLTHQGVAI